MARKTIDNIVDALKGLKLKNIDAMSREEIEATIWQQFDLSQRLTSKLPLDDTRFDLVAKDGATTSTTKSDEQAPSGPPVKIG